MNGNRVDVSVVHCNSLHVEDTQTCSVGKYRIHSFNLKLIVTVNKWVILSYFYYVVVLRIVIVAIVIIQ